MPTYHSLDADRWKNPLNLHGHKSLHAVFVLVPIGRRASGLKVGHCRLVPCYWPVPAGISLALEHLLLTDTSIALPSSWGPPWPSATALRNTVLICSQMSQCGALQQAICCTVRPICDSCTACTPLTNTNSDFVQRCAYNCSSWLRCDLCTGSCCLWMWTSSSSLEASVFGVAELSQELSLVAFYVPLDTTGHFRAKSVQAVNCTSTDNRKTKKQTNIWTLNTEKQTPKLAMLWPTTKPQFSRLVRHPIRRQSGLFYSLEARNGVCSFELAWVGSYCRCSMKWLSIVIISFSGHPSPPIRQHLSYDVCLEVRGEIIRTVLCCIVYWSCAQS